MKDQMKRREGGPGNTELLTEDRPPDPLESEITSLIAMLNGDGPKIILKLAELLGIRQFNAIRSTLNEMLRLSMFYRDYTAPQQDNRWPKPIRNLLKQPDIKKRKCFKCGKRASYVAQPSRFDVQGTAYCKGHEYMGRRKDAEDARSDEVVSNFAEAKRVQKVRVG
jgi:hypothetical protein